MICGSGVGASVAANKVKGVRASVCHDTYSAHQGVEHDDMNVLCLGARIVGIELARELAGTFVSAEYVPEERFQRRLDKVLDMESKIRPVLRLTAHSGILGITRNCEHIPMCQPLPAVLCDRP